MKTKRRSTRPQSAIRNPKSAITRARLTVERLEERTVLSSFAASFGGTGNENVRPPDFDAAGNTYLSGLFSDTADFDPSAGVVSRTSAGFTDVFAAKYDSAGALAWARSFGGTDYDSASRTAFSAESDGDYVYVSGQFNGTADFGPGVGLLTSAGAADMFLIKLRAGDGTAVWGKSVQGTGLDEAFDLRVHEGRVYMTGTFNDTADFDPGPGTALLTASPTYYDAFVSVLDTNGNYVTAWQLTGAESEKIVGIALEGDDAYVYGEFFATTDFDPGPGVVARSNTGPGLSDHFLAKYSTSGALEWVDVFQADGYLGNGRRLSQDADSIFIAGKFYGTADMDPGPGTSLLSTSAQFDAVVASYSKLDGALQWANQYGSTEQNEDAFTTVVDATGALYIGGQFLSSTVDFNPAGPGGVLNNSTPLSSLKSDGFVLRVNAATGAYQDVWQIGGSGSATAFVYNVGGTEVYAASYYDGAVNVPNGVGFSSVGGNDGLLLAFDSALPQVSVQNVAKLEGNSGLTPFVFTLTRSGNTSGTSTVQWSTADGTATVANNDYVAASGVVTFGPTETTKTITVNVKGDTAIEQAETFSIRLSNAVGALIASGGGIGTIQDEDTPPTKFYVVDASVAGGTGSRTFEYTANGIATENYPLNTSGNFSPRGAASNVAGDKVWVVDLSKTVYVYSNSGGLLGSWTVGSLPANSDVQGIATNGTDVWIVEGMSRKVYRYAGAASRLSGSQNATSNFSLNSANNVPTDLVTNGTHIWVTNDGLFTDKVFRYSVNGSLQGSWTINNAGLNPMGITIDPANVNHIWIVDGYTDRVYQFNGATSRTSGSASPSTSFALAAGNTNPQGIADPPVGDWEPMSASAWQGSSPGMHDAALLSLIGDWEALLGGAKKRR